MLTYYKAYCEILNMLKVRETINIEEGEKLALSAKEFSNKYNRSISSLDISKLTNKRGVPTYVLFHKEDLTIHKTNDVFIDLLKSRLTDDEIYSHNILIVFPLMGSSSAIPSTGLNIDLFKREKKILKEKHISVQFFTTYYASINILDHICSPEYKLITDEDEKETIFELCKAKSMNIILSSDPAVRYFGALNNDLFQIIRKGKEGLSVAWRRVQDISV